MAADRGHMALIDAALARAKSVTPAAPRKFKPRVVKKRYQLSDLHKEVLSGVFVAFNVTPWQLVVDDHHKSVALARHVGIWVLRRRLHLSYPELGRAFGDRDHTTCIHAFKKVERRRATDSAFRALTDKLLADCSPVDGCECSPGIDACTEGKALDRVW